MMRDTGTTTFAERQNSYDQLISVAITDKNFVFSNTYEYQLVHSGRMEIGMVVEIFPRFHQFLFVNLNEEQSYNLFK